MSRSVVLLLLVIVSLRAAASDWPMWRHDAARTAESPQQLPEDLDLLWRRDLPEPRPAFHDVRLQFDGGYEPVVMGRQRLFLASNVEDTVMAFDAGSGAPLWEHFTDGPVRHAPVAWKDRVLFGSDDGCFYCLAAATAELMWKCRAVPSERRLLGPGQDPLDDRG